MTRLRLSRLVVDLVSTLTVPLLAQEQHAPRDQWQRVDDVFRELGIATGSHVADLGAGSGYFTTRLAKAVGPLGRVYAVDVNPVSLRELREALRPELTNVDVIRADEDDPKLPAGRLDAVLVVNAYHEFAEYPTLLAKVRDALKPGGRLVLSEPTPRADATTRTAQTRRHSIAIELAVAELVQAGFEIIKQDVNFVKRPVHQGEGTSHSPIDWLLVARRPTGSPPF